MTSTTPDPRHEATLTALEHRVAARGTLDGFERGQLVAIRRYSPTLAPRVEEVVRQAQRNAPLRDVRSVVRGLVDEAIERATSSGNGGGSR